ncbi:6-phosphogluconolactonase [Ghiorsea bivora]|uniref:6-phosphogluconolactonase n=1 Tax=Ghiorsea bivora TaxID=1485545 RepID=UPI000571A314|nr:6-phosphogluconolactonase [Ghiorsea bivora]
MFFNPQTLKHFATGEEAASFVAGEVVRACAKSIAERGVFHWVLAGGSTPELCYRLLRDADMDWAKVHVWFGDERALPLGHADRNETMARNALLDGVAIPAANIHSIDFANGTQAAASIYAHDIAGIDGFDLVMLGMGEDGHTASLFPNHDTLQSNDLTIAEFDSPKPPSERVSMGFKALNNHKQCFILATGASKKEPLQAIQNGADLPVTHIENAVWVVDNAAWQTS